MAGQIVGFIIGAVVAFTTIILLQLYTNVPESLGSFWYLVCFLAGFGFTTLGRLIGELIDGF